MSIMYERPEDLKELALLAKCLEILNPDSAETLKFEMNRAAIEGYSGVSFKSFWKNDEVSQLKEAGYKVIYRSRYFIIWGN